MVDTTIDFGIRAGAGAPVRAAWGGRLALGASGAALGALGNLGPAPRRGCSRGASRIIFFGEGSTMLTEI